MLFCKPPLKRDSFASKEGGFKSEISLSAGSYVCNLVMYRLLHFQENSPLPQKAGFIHIPPDISLKRESQWTLDKLEQAVQVIINHC